jgi:hypothetical protein
MWAPLAGLLAFVPNASATLQLSLSSGATTIVITDGGAGDFNPATGQVTFIGSIGNWFLNVTTGTTGVNPIIDLSSADSVLGSGAGANSLVIKFSATDLSGPQLGGFTSNIGGTLPSTGTNSLTYQGYVDNSNTLFGTTTQIGSLLSFSPTGGFNGSTTGASGVISASLFSATEVVTIQQSANGQTSFNANIDTVPEPAGVLLLGGVLLLTTGAVRRKLGSRRS